MVGFLCYSLLIALVDVAGGEYIYTDNGTILHVPIRVLFGSSGDSAGLRDTPVQMCALDWAAYRRDPTLLPMFQDLALHSQCKSVRAAASGRTYFTTLGELEDEFYRRGCRPSGNHAPAAPGCAPAGLIFHESRCGSTLAANVLASLPYSLVYSESTPPMDVLTAPGLSAGERVWALRVVLAAMGRVVAAASFFGALPPGTPAQGWSPRHLYLKLQSSLTPHLLLFRAAFPGTPWVFLHREPVEVLASQFRNSAPPAPDAPVSMHVGHIRNAPCMMRAGSPFVQAVTRAADGARADGAAVPPEETCAASLAELVATALQQAAAARREALRALGIALADDDAWSGAELAEAVAGDTRVAIVGGQLLNASDGTGTLAGVGQALFVEYGRLPAALLPLLQGHFAPRAVIVAARSPAATGGLMHTSLSTDQGARQSEEGLERVVDAVRAADAKWMGEVARRYSKARGRTGDGTGGSPPSAAPHHAPAVGVDGTFTGDAAAKQARAWPALRAAATRLLSSLRRCSLAFNAEVAEGPASRASLTFNAASQQQQQQRHQGLSLAWISDFDGSASATPLQPSSTLKRGFGAPIAAGEFIVAGECVAAPLLAETMIAPRAAPQDLIDISLRAPVLGGSLQAVAESMMVSRTGIDCISHFPGHSSSPAIDAAAVPMLGLHAINRVHSSNKQSEEVSLTTSRSGVVMARGWGTQHSLRRHATTIIALLGGCLAIAFLWFSRRCCVSLSLAQSRVIVRSSR